MALPPVEKLNAQQRAMYEAFLENKIEITAAIEAQILALSPRTEKLVHKESEDDERTAELVLLSLERPGAVIIKKCKQCHLEFGSNYKSVAYCSTECRAAALHDRGLEYDWTRPAAARYSGTVPPAILQPDLIKELKEWARWILELSEPAKTKPAIAQPSDTLTPTEQTQTVHYSSSLPEL